MARKKRKQQKPLVEVFAICGVLIALVWGVFGQTLSYGFVQYDDPPYVYDNPVVKRGITADGVAWAFTHVHSLNWHPLTTLSHMLDCQLYGLQAGAHHFTNVLLHTATVLLLFAMLWQLTGAMWRSAVAVGLFAIHPLRVESVAWISERKDVLSGLFFVLMLLAYVRYARAPSVKRYALVALAFVCGLMSKPMVVTAPFVLLLLDYWPFGRFAERAQSLGRLTLEKVPLFLLGAAGSVVTLLVQSHEVNRLHNSVSFQISNALVGYVTYLGQMIWPVKLAVFYPLPSADQIGPIQVGLALAFLLAVSATVIVFRRRYPYLLLGWFWYVLMLVPVIGLVQVGWQSHADRYTYLPQIGICVALVWIAFDLVGTRGRSRVWLGASVTVIIMALAGTAWAQTRTWRDTGTLWRHALAVTTNNYIAHHNLGFFLWTGDEAVAQFQEAIRLQPNYPSAYQNLARIELDRGEINDAISHLETSLKIEPDNAGICSELGTALLLKGRASEAAFYYNQALKIQPDLTTALNNLAWILATCTDDSLRNGPRAVDLSKKAVELSHDQNATFLRTLGAALAENGRYGEASETARRALALAEKQNNRRLAERLRGDIDMYAIDLPCRDPSLAEER